MVSTDEVFRRGVRLGYSVEILSRYRHNAGTMFYVSIYDYHPTAAAGYENPRLFHGNLPGAISWIEEREEWEKQKQKERKRASA